MKLRKYTWNSILCPRSLNRDQERNFSNSLTQPRRTLRCAPVKNLACFGDIGVTNSSPDRPCVDGQIANPNGFVDFQLQADRMTEGLVGI